MSSVFGDLSSGASAGETVLGGVDIVEAKKKRDETGLQIRKQKKEDRLRQRRRTGMVGGGLGGGATDADFSSIPEHVAGIMCNDPQKLVEHTKAFRKLLSRPENPPIAEVIAAGIVPKFVEFLKHSNNNELQFEAAWVLTNIASGQSHQTLEVLKAGAVPIFVELLLSPVNNVREQAVWALGNVAGDSSECRDIVLQAGALGPLLQLITNDAPLRMLRNSTWTLSNLFRGKPSPPLDLMRPALPVLARLIYHSDVEVLVDACWCFQYVSDVTDEDYAALGTDKNPRTLDVECCQAILEAGAASRCIELLLHPEPKVRIPALRTIGSIVSGAKFQTQQIVSLGVLPLLHRLLRDELVDIRKETCWTISNITADQEQVQAVIDAKLMPELIRLLDQDEPKIRKEAAWAISNAVIVGSAEQVKYLVNIGCIPPLCNLLDQPDPIVLGVALDTINYLLGHGNTDMDDLNEYYDLIDECEAFEKIYDLTSHGQDNLQKTANEIISKYYDDYDEDEDVDAAPEVAQSGEQFSFGNNPPNPPTGGNFNFGGLR